MSKESRKHKKLMRTNEIAHYINKTICFNDNDAQNYIYGKVVEVFFNDIGATTLRVADEISNEQKIIPAAYCQIN